MGCAEVRTSPSLFLPGSEEAPHEVEAELLREDNFYPAEKIFATLARGFAKVINLGIGN
jgi:hypothetical protein